MPRDDDHAARIDPGLARATRRPAPTNPFQPGFGTFPPRFAGRHHMIAEVLDRIEGGPGRHDFHTVIVGVRGVGKTVLLGEVLQQGSARNRWAAIQWNASRSLHQAAAEQAAGVRRQLQGALRHVEGSLDVKAAPGGVGAEARIGVTRRHEPSTSAYAILEELGRVADARHGVVVIAADELQAAELADLKELTAAIQQLANVQRLPVSLVGVGLPSTGHVLRRAEVSPGFIERLAPLKIGNLDSAAARDALATPFFDVGRSIDEAAINRLVAATHGYPYAIQLAGHACWAAAGDAGAVTVAHADAACAQLESALDAQIFAPRWQAMSPRDREYLIVAARLCDDRGVVSTTAIADALGRAPQHVTRNRDRLINQHHALRPFARGEVQFSIPGFADWVRRHRPRGRGRPGTAERRPPRAP